ncbi:MAG: POT family MFS transporter [Akkermansiaceae bacterium]|nr:POT family MFS transporter [Akkermansiaceae bacterium]MCF7731987.1 POT family MFS transporter [Akkermansiaceae bacterium]
MSYRTTPHVTDRMPPGVPWIIGNEAAERFSFYGMRTILVVFMAKFLHVMDGRVGVAMSEAEAKEHYHMFVAMVYFTPLLGALLSDIVLGKYRTILWLSMLYCAGHASLAMMGTVGQSSWWLVAGLVLICLGAGGIKPCVSSNVGDQFGPANQHLLTRVYNWFYFSINFGSFFSTLLTPWLLEWYGPHWAFGIPGVLMAIATLLFWMGRRKFTHVPPAGVAFFEDLFSREGMVAMAKLIPLFLFFAVFWSLYDQTASSWVFQASQMDLDFMGIIWLESQVQAINPILILLFIPLFTFVIYPAANRLFNLTPLRKIGIGFFLVVLSFALTAEVQSWIDRGQTPSIGWQFLSFIIITAAEIMVSIVGLEFAYTQAPKRLKSMIMSLFLLAVFGGNIFTSGINKFIQIPSAAAGQAPAELAKLPAGWEKSPQSVVLPGFDGQAGTPDDFVQEYADGEPSKLGIPGLAAYEAAALKVEEQVAGNGGRLPNVDAVTDLGSDPWGNPIHYEILHGEQCRLISAGPDREENTRWDQGLIVNLKRPGVDRKKSWSDKLHPAEPWLTKRHRELDSEPAAEDKATGITFARTAFSGGQTKLQGAAYYRFFMWLMLGASLVFVPFAMLYRPRTYLQ